MRAAAIVLALAMIALLFWWLRDDPAPRAERAGHAPEPQAAVRERLAAKPAEPDAPPAAKSVAVEVLIRRPDDAGVKGVTVRLLAEREVARAVTGDDGVARFPAAPATLLQVWALGRRLGTVSPAEGERRLEYTVEELLELVVRVTCDGVARLPEGLRVTAPVLVDPVYDAERAEVRGRFAPPPDQRSFFVTVTAPGYAPTEVPRALPRRPAPIEAEVDLTPRWRVVIAVTGPHWAAQALELETPNVAGYRKVGDRWQEVEANQWRRAEAGRRFNLNRQEIRYDLRPGRYRLRLKNMPVVMREFEVERDDVRLAIDLSGAGTQEIVLRAPPELSLAAARLQADWVSIAPYSHDAGEARFSVILPGDREVTFEPRHLLARPAESTRLVAARDEITVDLRLRPLVRFELPEDAPDVVYFVLTRDGTKVAFGTASAYAGGYAVPADPGRYSLRVTPRGWEPHTRDIEVPEGGLDLGLIPLR